MFGLEPPVGIAIELLKLTQLFRERHARQQGIDPSLDVLAFLRVGGGRRGQRQQERNAERQQARD